jgi:hypothetical protein
LSSTPNEIRHVQFGVARVFKGDVMPPISRAGEQGLTIEDPIAAEARNRNPVALTAYLGEFFTVTKATIFM